MAELLEVIDENGNPTGVAKTKAEILTAGDWRKVIHIWLVDDDSNLLIQRRAKKGGIFDDMWDVTVGGGVSYGEQSLHAAKRELQEELGLELPEEDFQLLGTWKMPPKTVDENREMKDFSDTYLVHVPKIDPAKLKLAPREVQKVDVISLKDLAMKIQDNEIYKKWVQHGREYYLGVSEKIFSNTANNHTKIGI
ncbi:MAG TPA: NUDIX domain-containing protein [Candidatus Saccharimonadales bacterium]|nr:NUDIX domain-containing protein [Candidatus Saccharimonadales bacterium]